MTWDSTGCVGRSAMLVVVEVVREGEIERVQRRMFNRLVGDEGLRSMKREG